MEANYDKTIPKEALLSLKKINDSGIIGIPKMKQLIKDGQIEYVKVGNKNHIARDVLIAFLERNTFTTKKISDIGIYNDSGYKLEVKENEQINK